MPTALVYTARQNDERQRTGEFGEKKWPHPYSNRGQSSSTVQAIGRNIDEGEGSASEKCASIDEETRPLSLTSHITAHSRSYPRPHLMRHAHDPMPIWVTARQSGPPDTVQQARSTFVESCPWSPRMPFTLVLRTCQLTSYAGADGASAVWLPDGRVSTRAATSCKPLTKTNHEHDRSEELSAVEQPAKLVSRLSREAKVDRPPKCHKVPRGSREVTVPTLADRHSA